MGGEEGGEEGGDAGFVRESEVDGGVDGDDCDCVDALDGCVTEVRG